MYHLSTCTTLIQEQRHCVAVTPWWIQSDQGQDKAWEIRVGVIN